MSAAVVIENERLYGHLETSNKAKSGFLSVMSHELETALHMTLGYSALGQAGALSRSDDDSNALKFTEGGQVGVSAKIC